MRGRTRKRERKFEDTASLMEAGGEGFIIDPIFRIKLGTYPILKDFKVRSYLNFMASLPMKRNPATGYFEFAETPEEITALCKAYFWAAEPGALADSGYDQFRINKARHLLVQPIGNTDRYGAGINYYIAVNASGHTITTVDLVRNHVVSMWQDAVVGVGGVSPSGTIYGSHPGIYVSTDAATTITLQMSFNNIDWFDHTDLVFTAAGSKAQNIMLAGLFIRAKTTNAATISVLLVETWW